MKASGSSPKRGVRTALPILILALAAIAGFIVGGIAAPGRALTFARGIFTLAAVIVLFWACRGLNHLLAACGKLLYGRSKGFSLLSFQIGPLCVFRSRRSLRTAVCRKGFRVDCQMAPPEQTPAKTLRRYYSVGMLLNLCTGALSFLILLLSPKTQRFGLGKTTLLLLFLTGILAVLSQNAHSRKRLTDGFLRRQLKRTAGSAERLIAAGQIRLRAADGEALPAMPEAFFALPQPTHPLYVPAANDFARRAIETGAFDEAARALGAVQRGALPLYPAGEAQLLLCFLRYRQQDAVGAANARNSKAAAFYRRQQPEAPLTLAVDFCHALLGGEGSEAAKKKYEALTRSQETARFPADAAAAAAIAAAAVELHKQRQSR